MGFWSGPWQFIFESWSVVVRELGGIDIGSREKQTEQAAAANYAKQPS
jgi:hypothetical protein